MAFELVSPPLLSPSKPDEELFLYLAMSSTAVSSALISEEDHVQLLVYYISRTLRKAEKRYPPYRKVSLRFDHSNLQAQAILPSTHHSGSNEKAPPENNR